MPAIRPPRLIAPQGTSMSLGQQVYKENSKA